MTETLQPESNNLQHSQTNNHPKGLFAILSALEKEYAQLEKKVALESTPGSKSKGQILPTPTTQKFPDQGPANDRD